MKRELALVALIAAAAFVFIAWNANRQSTSVAATAASVMLQSMERGYQCRVAGREIDSCKDEQLEIWRHVAAGEPYSEFGSKH